jgi:hypothetical protein
MSADNRPRWRPFSEYLERFGERNRAKRENEGDNVTFVSDEDAKEEAYWRDRERWHQEQQQFKKAA